MSRASEDVLNQTIGSVLPQRQAQFLIARYRSIVESGHSLSEEFRSFDPGVVARWVAHQAVKLGDAVSVTARDITRHKELEARLREMAEKDALTGLPNRALFFDRLESALARALRGGSGLSVLYLDLDRSKDVNDTHGHAIGDRVLVEFARRLRNVVRASDTVARLAGDEFAVVLEGAISPEDAERACNAILQAMAEPFYAGVLALRIATSIGMAFSRSGEDAIDDLVARADRCLYEAKQAGRNAFVMEGQRGTSAGDTARTHRDSLEKASD